MPLPPPPPFGGYLGQDNKTRIQNQNLMARTDFFCILKLYLPYKQ